MDAPEKLTEKGKKQLEELLQFHPDLQEAYRLKNALHHWFKTSNHKTARKGLEDWFEQVENASLQRRDTNIQKMV